MSRRASQRLSRSLQHTPALSEPLEGRLLLSTYTVVNVGDSGAGTFRAAIQAANGNAGPDTINFAVAGVIRLTTGQLEVSDDLSVVGPGAGTLTISAGNLSRVFQVDGGASVSISGLTIADGQSPPASGPGDGGGLYNLGSTTLSADVFTHNTAGRGGAIFTRGPLTISGSTIDGNQSSGGILAPASGGSAFDGGPGGGIFADSGSVVLTDSTIGNNAAGDGTPPPVLGSAGSGKGGDGGGIYVAAGALLNAANVTISGNRAGNGVTASLNAAASAGGSGGGIFAAGAIRLTNVTISGNFPGSGGGGFAGGAPVASMPGAGAGIVSLGSSILNNTLVAGNYVISPYPTSTPFSADVSGTLDPSGAYNLIGDGSGGLSTTDHNLLGTAAQPLDARLGPLANHGGPTDTMALLAGSPAINAGSNGLASQAALATDQRGQPRVSGGLVDIGAFELQLLAGDVNLDGQVGFPDLLALAQHYGKSAGVGWSQGDLNLDGTVNFTDLLVLAQHYDDSLLPQSPSNLQVTNIPGGEVDLTWSNNSVAASGFCVERAAAGGLFVPIAVLDSPLSTRYVDLNLPPLTDYTYRVVAIAPVTDSLSSPAVALRTAAPLSTYVHQLPPGQHPDWMTNVNGTVYFAAVDQGGVSHGVWKTDGTPPGTVLVHFGNDRELTSLGGALYFTEYDPSTQVIQIYRSDGTAAGTRPVVSTNGIYPGPTDLNLIGIHLLFIMPASTNFPTYYSLYTTDISNNNVNPPQPLGLSGSVAIGSSLVAPTPDALPTVINGRLYFSDTGGQNGATQLWTSDGTQLGTRQLAVINAQGGAWPYDFTAFAGQTYFFAQDPIHHVGMWKTDGTSGGTVFVHDIAEGQDAPPAGQMEVVGDALYFLADLPQGQRALFKSDGTDGGTAPVLNPSSGQPFSPVLTLAAAQDEVYFIYGNALYRSDGTAAGTAFVHALTNLPPTVPDGVIPAFIATVGDHTFYTDAPDLWVTDGTPGGTVPVADLYRNLSGYYVLAPGDQPYVVLGDHLFFSAANSQNGRDLYVASVVPPAAPSGLSATVAAGGVQLTWASHSSEESGFVIDRSYVADFSTIDQSFFLPAGTEDFLDSTVKSGTVYYRVRAIDAGGESDFVNAAPVVVPASTGVTSRHSAVGT